MKIAVIGIGYVGLVTGVCFAEMGNTVTCIDIDEKKIQELEKGINPIYEPGLDLMIEKNINKGSLLFTTKLEEVIDKVEIVFIAVGTPMSDDGTADLGSVFKVAEGIGGYMNRSLIVVNKSTVPVGSADKVKVIIQKKLDQRKINISFDVVSNPEFLKEGVAINDFMKPDRIVIGSDSEKAITKMKQLYSPFFRTHDRFITMDIRSAEMTKYAANAMLATRISFMNEIANISERVGADVNQVRIGIGSDKRIGYSFIYPGAGYGGSCLPKDVKALKKIAEDVGYSANLISSVEMVNDAQKLVLVEKIIKRFGENLSDYTFGVWGLAFKPGTDDVRESPAIFIVKELISKGAKIKAFDPKAMVNSDKFYLSNEEKIEYCESKYLVLKNADALILLTEWKEFRSPDFELIKNELNNSVIFDGRNQYMAYNLDRKGFEYYRIGR